MTASTEKALDGITHAVLAATRWNVGLFFNTDTNKLSY